MPEFECIYIPPELVPAAWHGVEGHIRAALAHGAGEYLPEDIRDEAIEARMQLWGIVSPGALHGAAATQIHAYPRKRVCYCIALGGVAFDDWADVAVRAIERFARRQRCDVGRINGRPGWVRRLAGHGYMDRYRTIDKVLR